MAKGDVALKRLFDSLVLSLSSRWPSITLALIVATAVALPARAPAHDEQTPFACAGSILNEEDDRQTDLDSAIALEEHSLQELLDADPEKNLAVKHPSIVMNAFQRVKSWLYFKEPQIIPAPPYFTEMVRMFPVLSLGLPETDQRRIIDQFLQSEAFGNYIDRGADGDGSASKVPIFTGPPGTGKTEFLTILLRLSQHLQTNVPDFHNFTVEWRNLLAIPKLRPIVNSFTVNEHGLQTGETFQYPVPCPLGDSPLVLLPPQLQQRLTALATPRVQKMIRVTPTPWGHMCPQCHHVRTAIIEHYAKLKGKTSLSNREVVEALAQHVVIKRRVIGRGGRIPKINAEGKDVDYGGLVFTPNAFIMTQFGQDHPFAYWISGKVAAGHGGIVYFDEFWRNDPALRDVFLELFENQVLSRGAFTLRLNFVPLGASNTESVRAAEQKDQARAQLDRSYTVEMPQPIGPHSIAKTMLLMKGVDRIQQQALEDANLAADLASSAADAERQSPIVPARLDDLYPMPTPEMPLAGPDHRFKMWLRSEDKKVHISPHSLMFMALVVGGTRLTNDVSLARETAGEGGYKIIGSSAFSDFITRLKVLSGQLRLTTAELMELGDLRDLLKEGTAGVTTRDAANIWLTESVSEAMKPGNGYCVTPAITERVFKRLLQRGAIKYPDVTTRLLWEHIMYAVAHHFVVPSIENDVNAAFGRDSGSAEAIYDEIWEELYAMSQEPDTQFYSKDNGDSQRIKFDRLEEIERIYKEQNNGRPLMRQQIVLNHSVRPGAANRAPVRRHGGLLAAIHRYLALNSAKTVPYEAFLNVATTGDGDTTVKAKFNAAHRIMVHRFGYCEHCIRAALQLAGDSNARLRRQAQPTNR